MSDIEKKWYVVRAISGQEKKIKEILEAEIAAEGLQHYVGQILIPVEKVFQIRNGKKVSKERNLFPGYIYLEAALIGEVPHVVQRRYRCDWIPWSKETRRANGCASK